MILGLVILACGAGLYIYNNIESAKIEEENLNVVNQIEAILEEKTESENDDEESEEIDEEAYITIDGVNYIGIIYIPVLDNLSLPVIQECTDANLKISICKYAGNTSKNNLVIAGHRYKSTFAKLSKLEVGNLAYYKDVNGNVFKYKLKTVETLSPSSVSEMQTGDWDLTLFTCTYNNRNREAYRFEIEY